MTFSVAWLSPFGRASDIGAFSRNLLREFARPEVAREVAVTLFVQENGPTFWTALPVVALTGMARDRELLSAFDLVVFNIGNNQENHCHINRLALQVPGVVIVHDLIMQHYLAFELFERLRRRDGYARLVGEYYGHAGLVVLGRSQICSEVAAAAYAPWDSRHAAAMPLIEPFLHTASAVVVHSGFGEAAVRRAADVDAEMGAETSPGMSDPSPPGLPLLRLQLPWDQKPSVPDAERQVWAGRTTATGLCSVVCFGHISRSKCLDQVIQAFGDSESLRGNARLTIAGYPGDRGYASELERQVRQLGLSRHVAFAFDVSDDGLAAIKHDADVFVNLRHPNTETASGSLVEQMNTGRPVVIFPSGGYAEIDEAAAVRVDQASGTAGLRAALEAIVRDPPRRIAVGEAGRQHGLRVGRAEYVTALTRFLAEHMTLLRARKLCAAGRRMPAPDLTVAAVGARWLDQVVATREVFAAIEAPRHQLDLLAFRDWEASALLGYIALGLFGQAYDGEAGTNAAPGSPLEAMLARLLRRSGRLGLYRVVAPAHLLWCLGRMGADAATLLPTLLAQPILELAAYRLLAETNPVALARGLYLGLLARIGMTAEVDILSRRLPSEPLERLVREILRSEEFRGRVAGMAGEGAAAALALACENAVPSGTPYPPLPSGVPDGALSGLTTFSTAHPEARRYLFAGWHHLEEQAVWSRAPVAVALFSLPADGRMMAMPDPASQGLALSMSVRFPALRATGPRDFCLRVNGGPSLPFRCTQDDWMTCTLPLPTLEAGESGYMVEFDTQYIVNLARQGFGRDTRDLGIRLRLWELLPILAEPAAAAEIIVAPVVVAPVVVAPVVLAPITLANIMGLPLASAA